MVTKAQVINAFHNLHNNLVLGLAGLAVLPYVNLEHFKREALWFRDPAGVSTPMDISPLVGALADPVQRRQITEEAEKSLRRTALREAHALIWWYAIGTGQQTAIRDNRTVAFLYFARNILSHPEIGVVSEKAIERLRQPVSWRTRRIDRTMLGKEFHFSLEEVFGLLKDVESIANDLP